MHEPAGNSDMQARILGTWRMVSWTRQLAETGDVQDALGPEPFGYLNYAADGRLMVFVLKSGRPRPATALPSNEEKVALFDSMFAYVGTYEVHDDRVVHTLDGSWNELWTGTKQVRFLAFDNERLIYTTAETVDPMDGQRCTYRVTFKRA